MSGFVSVGLQKYQKVWSFSVHSSWQLLHLWSLIVLFWTFGSDFSSILYCCWCWWISLLAPWICPENLLENNYLPFITGSVLARCLKIIQHLLVIWLDLNRAQLWLELNECVFHATCKGVKINDSCTECHTIHSL